MFANGTIYGLVFLATLPFGRAATAVGASGELLSVFPAEFLFAFSAREHWRLTQKGVVVDLLDEEIRHVGP